MDTTPAPRHPWQLTPDTYGGNVRAAPDGPDTAMILGAVADALGSLGDTHVGAQDAAALGAVQALVDDLSARTVRSSTVPDGYTRAYAEQAGDAHAVVGLVGARAVAMRQQLVGLRELVGQSPPEGCELSARQLLAAAANALAAVLEHLEIVSGSLGHILEPHPHEMPDNPE